MGRHRLDLNGQVFGCWTVISESDRLYYWHAKCKCGHEAQMTVANLKRNSDGCVKCGRTGRTARHGLSGQPLYHVYVHMIRRCYTDTCVDYKYYGGRGITVCDEWRGHPEVFMAWAMGAGYIEMKGVRNIRTTLDRRDNDGNYCPENCRFVDMDTQIHNRGGKRWNVMTEIGGEVKRLKDWCDVYHINYRSVSSRIKMGWSVIDALTTPPIRAKRKSGRIFYEREIQL